MSRPYRNFRGKRHASGYSEGNYYTSSGRGRSQIPRSLYIASALSLSLSLLSSSLLLLSWIAPPNLHNVVIPFLCLASALYSLVSYLGSASSFCQKLIYPTRSSLVYRWQKSPSSVVSAIFYCTPFCFNRMQRLVIICRNNRFAHYPVVTILTQPVLCDLIPGLTKGDYPRRLLPMAIVPLFRRPLLLVTPPQPQSR
jgi:hypothetical protein